jgi:hypothetical protein
VGAGRGEEGRSQGGEATRGEHVGTCSQAARAEATGREGAVGVAVSVLVGPERRLLIVRARSCQGFAALSPCHFGCNGLFGDANAAVAREVMRHADQLVGMLTRLVR